MTRASSITLPPELRAVLAGLSSTRVAGDQHWILALLRRHGLDVVTMLWRMLGAEDEVLDAYQSAVCKLTARGRGAIGRNLPGYFYRTAMNAGIEILRARRQREKHWPSVAQTQHRRNADRAAASAAAFSQREAIERLRQAIHRLPPHLRDVVILRDLGELPYRQVAAVLGIRATTARVYRRMAVVRLAALLGPEETI